MTILASPEREIKVSGFSMCRNAEKLYYPVVESVQSALEFVDEFVMVVGKGDPDDRTLELLQAIDSPKLRIIESEWDTDLFPKGTVHAQQTDLAKSYCRGSWLLYLQADEVLHEDDVSILYNLLDAHHANEEVEGILFQYLHFWGDYAHINRCHGWYPKEIRMIRNRPAIHSWQSAQSFRVIERFDGQDYRANHGTRKLKVVESEARIFHYGWVRPPEKMTLKMQRLDRIHSHESERYKGDFDYGNMRLTQRFEGSHPAVMTQRIAMQDWDPTVARASQRPRHKHERWKNRLLTWIEQHMLGGRQLFAFQNYTKLS